MKEKIIIIYKTIDAHCSSPADWFPTGSQAAAAPSHPSLPALLLSKTSYDMGYPCGQTESADLTPASSLCPTSLLLGRTVKEAEKFLINVSTTQQQLSHQCALLNPKHGIITSTVNSIFDKARKQVKDMDWIVLYILAISEFQMITTLRAPLYYTLYIIYYISYILLFYPILFV